MKCVVSLYNENEDIEIVTDLADVNINVLKQFANEHEMSFEELVEDLIEGYIKLRRL